MTEKLLVSVQTLGQREAIRATGVEVLAEYVDGVLVRASDEQAIALADASLETFALPSPPVQTASATFDIGDAEAAEADSPLAADPARTAYYLVSLVGPVKEEWGAAIKARGATVQGALSGFRLLVGMLPSVADELRRERFVESVVPYRPAMKVSPRLRADVPGRALDKAALVDFADLGVSDGLQQVEVSVFLGESTEDVAHTIREHEGIVLSVDPRTVVARVEAGTIRAVADRQGVEAVLPHDFPQTTNDRASAIINVPDDHVFGGFSLTGAGQIVGVIDSGLDTGDPATMHPDLAGRVSVVSSPNQLAQLSTDPPPFDDGPQDQSAHGTNVAGSVAGSGAAAVAAGSTVVPRGTAPEAHVHFTSVGQRVAWGPDVGLPPPPVHGLYGIPTDAGTLYTTAYSAGARIHTNSWGNDQPGMAGTYNAQARAADRFMFTRRDALVLFSAGNTGRDVDADGQVDPGSISPPGTAKSVLTVGATENDRPAGSTPTPGIDRTWAQALPAAFAAFTTAGHVSDNPGGTALFSSRGP
jgi:serine protease AprX